MPEPTTCSTVTVTPELCCYGACLDQATHEIVTDEGRAGQRIHRRCPTHLAWSHDKQTLIAETKLEPSGA